MKAALIIICLFTAISNTLAATVCYEDKPSGNGTYDWDGTKSYCPTSGHFCQKTTTGTSKNVTIVPITGGVLITTTHSGITFDVVGDPTHGTFTSYHDGKNYTFGLHEVLHITYSTEYPQLNGINVNLNGLTTNSNGQYTVFVPVN